MLFCFSLQQSSRLGMGKRGLQEKTAESHASLELSQSGTRLATKFGISLLTLTILIGAKENDTQTKRLFTD
jgi:hypothetical protein